MTPLLSLHQFTVRDGAEFTVKGSASDQKDSRFSINLSTQAKIEPTTSLHFEVQFKDEKKVVLNSVEDGKWGPEHVEDNHFVLGGDFEVNVKCTAKSFKIRFGGEEAVFNFRGKPMAWVKYIYIEGQATINGLEVKEVKP